MQRALLVVFVSAFHLGADGVVRQVFLSHAGADKILCAGGQAGLPV